MHTKGPTPQLHDGSNLRIGIIHARWNDTIIEPLVAGTKAKLTECGVKESNIIVQSVPGAWELPIAVQRCVSSFSPLPSPRTCSPSSTKMSFSLRSPALLRGATPPKLHSD